MQMQKQKREVKEKAQNKTKINKSGWEWYSIKCNMLQTFYKCMVKAG